ncbi:MAG: hypothetical protein GY839_07495 [candidate division Zixibacteria bacterium]|nr:hypothetical protein [candidate division Zixibacteria bacterium]
MLTNVQELKRKGMWFAGIVVAVSLLILLLTGCPKKPPAAVVTFTFPAGVTCTSANTTVTTTAVVTGAGGSNPMLTITICVMCNVGGTATGVVGAAVSGSLDDVTLPSGYPRTFKGPTVAGGCYVKKIPLRNVLDATVLKGQQFSVTVKDTSTPPLTISTTTVTITQK